MARPLPEKRLEKMDLTVKTFDGESKKLGKQVGFNKYVVDKETHEIVMLVEKLEKKGDALLILEDHGKDKPVIKIVENLFHTADKPYGYVLDADGKVKFLDEDVKVYDTHQDAGSAEEVVEDINNIPEGGSTSVETTTPATFSNDTAINLDGNRTVNYEANAETTFENGSVTVANGSSFNGEFNAPVEMGQNAMSINGNADLEFNADSTMNTESIEVNGGNVTVSGGK